ncbi:holo-ACP synthase [Marinicrinis lubricantis]|uniref:Holo-[acyl-carrier-protein] synthase n=1 Tax=Marinicrinis lubricantis TaxID=2086470 RepID=A0ABW1IRW9_9BACL
MIHGIGCDILEISRIRRIVSGTHGPSFLRKVLTEREQELYEVMGSETRKVEYAAGRFAAKESVSKALGCGICGKLGLKDIEIVPDSAGKPLCRITERSRLELGLNASFVIHLSISHSEEHVVAYAVVEV